MINYENVIQCLKLFVGSRKRKCSGSRFSTRPKRKQLIPNKYEVESIPIVDSDESDKEVEVRILAMYNGCKLPANNACCLKIIPYLFELRHPLE